MNSEQCEPYATSFVLFAGCFTFFEQLDECMKDLPPNFQTPTAPMTEELCRYAFHFVNKLVFIFWGYMCHLLASTVISTRPTATIVSGKCRFVHNNGLAILHICEIELTVIVCSDESFNNYRLIIFSHNVVRLIYGNFHFRFLSVLFGKQFPVRNASSPRALLRSCRGLWMG